MRAFIALFNVNLKILYRDKQGFFFMLILPAVLYVAVCLLPVGKFLTPNLKYSSYVLPGIIAMTIMQTGIYNLAYWMVELKSKNVLKRFLATPIKGRDLILAVIASRSVVILLQLLALALLGIALFQAPVNFNPLSLLAIIIITVLGGGIFLAIGLLISNYANTYQAAAPITSTIGLPLAILGNIFFPIEMLPKTLQIIANILPITHMSNGLRQAFLYPFNAAALTKDILILAVWLVLLLALAISALRLNEEK